ncbi:MAG: YesU family protein [Butyrivibrio sp.]|nr:YesU family protein [Butyrivibrio sp.]
MKELIYENSLGNKELVKDFILEGKADISFDEGVMRMENSLSASEGQKANYVYWCPVEFPENIEVTWEFRPIKEPGLAILFFAAKGINGESIFDKKLAERTGEYPLYHHGDINAFHVSYFRRKEPDERAFHTCNLRKSYGFHLVTQGADPIPDASIDSLWYELKVIKNKNKVTFSVNDLQVFEFNDDGTTYGPVLSGGCIGFRQLAPMIAEYRNLKVYELK